MVLTVSSNNHFESEFLDNVNRQSDDICGADRSQEVVTNRRPGVQDTAGCTEDAAPIHNTNLQTKQKLRYASSYAARCSCPLQDAVKTCH